MGSVIGNTLKLSIFGESHGSAIGAVLDGFVPGLSVDFPEIEREMARRRPNKSAHSTKRNETDQFEIQIT